MKTLSKRVAVLIMSVLMVFSFAMVSVTTKNAQASTSSNKTAVLNTSWYTRVTAPIPYSGYKDSRGGAIELDVVSSNLKTPEHIATIKEYSPKFAGQVAGTKIIPAYTNFVDAFGGVVFDFWNKTEAFDNKAGSSSGGMHWGGTCASGNSYNAMMYMADGQIRLFSYPTPSNGSTRTMSQITAYVDGELWWNSEYFDALSANNTYPTGNKYYGDIQEVKDFLNPGFSYKVEYIYGSVNSIGEVYNGMSSTPGAGNQYCPWYVVYKKAIGATDWAVSFAFAITRAGSPATETSCYAGFEVQAGRFVDRFKWATGDYDQQEKNFMVEMEIDNVSIYSLDKVSDAKTVDFESGTDNFALTATQSESTIQAGGSTYNAGLGYSTPTGGFNKYAINETTIGGVKFNSINATAEQIKGPATRSINTRNIYTVTYKDKATNETLVTRQVMEGLDSVAPTYHETGKLYVWETEANNVTGDVVVFGSEDTREFTINFDANGGTGTIAPVSGKFGTRVTLPTEGFTREHYTFAGWAVAAGSSFAKIETYSIKDYNDTIYALWEKNVYDVVFMNGSEVMYQESTEALGAILYQGAEPIKEGAKFVGWDKATDEITGHTTVNAQFMENYDESVQDKYLNVSSTGANAYFFGRQYDKTIYSAIIEMEILKAEGVSGASVVVGSNQVVNLINLFSDGVSLKIVWKYGKVTLLVKPNGAPEYLDYTKHFESSIASNIPTSASEMVGVVVNGNNLNVSIGELGVYENGLDYVDEFEYSDAQTTTTEIFKNSAILLMSQNNATYKFENAPKNVTVTFKDASGNVLETRKLRSGESTAEYLSDAYNVAMTSEERAKLSNVTADVEVMVTLTPNKFDINFVTTGIDTTLYDITAVENKTDVDYKSSVTIPTVAFEGKYGIIGWASYANATIPEYKCGETVEMPAKDLQLYPVYGYKTFKVTFTNEDGTVLEVKEVPYMGTAIFGGEEPVKEGYLFTGWSESISSVDKDMTVTAQFRKLQIVENNDGGETDAPIVVKNTLSTILLIGSIVALAGGATLITLAFVLKKKV